MKTATLKRPHGRLGRGARSPRPWTALVGLAALLVAADRLTAMPAVDTLTGGPSWFYPHTAYGFMDGFTDTDAKFHTPFGIALDATAEYLFVADRDNNAVRQLDLAGNWTYTFVPNDFVPASLIAQPVGVALDSAGDVYVLNRGNGNNGTVLQFDTFGELVKTNATGLTNAAGMALDNAGNIYLTVQGSTLIRIAPNGLRTTIAATFPPGTSLQGIVVKHDGMIAACDSGRHGIYLIDPSSGGVTTNAGFHGAGDFTSANNVASSSTARFNQPYGVAEAGDGTLVVTDYGNHRVKIVLPSGVVTNLYGVRSNLWYGPANPSQGIFPGWWDGTVAVPDLLGGVEARQPVGVVLASDGTVYTTEIYYHVIRKVTSTGLPPPPPSPPPPPTIVTVTTAYGQVTLTWSTAAGATNYYVKRSPSTGGPYTTMASTSGTSYTDTDVINGRTYYYVVSASNAGGEGPDSDERSATLPLPPVPDPQIGYVDFPPPPPEYSVFHPVSSYDFYNDAVIVIKGIPGSGTYYEYGYTTNASLVPDPTSDSASIPSDYQDGLTPGQVSLYQIAEVAPYLTVKTMGAKGDGSPNSAVVRSTFQFRTGNPSISGANAALFTISDITANAHLYYTLDGSDPSPTNPSAVDLGTVATPTNVWTVSIAIQTNTLFKVRAFRDNYQPSALVSNVFLANDFVPNRISFGFAAGEASSDFVASPGQFFYAPVTLTIVPGAKMYSLQFNVTVTNLGAAPAVALGAMDFESFLEKPDPANPGFFLRIPPAMFVNYTTNVIFNGSTFVTNLIPNFTNLVFANNNLLGVGWLERFAHTNLYDTKLHDLIKYSQPHDTLFHEDNGKVVPGGYAFRVPGAAVPGNQYEIKLGRPSATSDGIGAPGSDVVIDTPTTGSLSNGAINAIKHVTVGQRKYVVGDVAPFRWFNAGDFGNTNSPAILNGDVMQVFQSAIYRLNMPPYDEKSWNGIGFANVSDFFDAMDSCGGTYKINASGYLELDTYVSGTNANFVFDGNDTGINSIAFGDGFLDVCDVYVTFRRSLDPSLYWFRRFWTDGVRVAEIVGNAPPQLAQLAATASAASVNLATADFIATAGQTLQIPVTAQIAGPYPIRVLMLSLSVDPLDGSPALTSAIQFTPNPALGPPSLTDSKGNGNYAATWLDSTITGLSGNATLGILTVQIPASAGSSAAYAIRFDHASASPNGLASFPKQTQTGLITLSDRSASTWGDGIPDSWRLRHFASVNNVLSAATADADSDGHSNYAECQTGTDPNDSESVLRAQSSRRSGTSPAFVVSWPSVAGKRYVIERAPALFGAAWLPLSTNTGTGLQMEYSDPIVTATPRFYRVQVVP